MDDDLAYSLQDGHSENEDRTLFLVWIVVALIVGSAIGWSIA